MRPRGRRLFHNHSSLLRKKIKTSVYIPSTHSLTTAWTAARAVVFSLGPVWDDWQDLKTAELGKLKELGVKDPGVAFSQVVRYPTQLCNILNDRMQVPERSFAITTPSEVEIEEEKKFDMTVVNAWLKQKIFKIHMSVRATSNILRLTFTVFYTGAGQNPVRSLFALVGWRDCFRPIHNSSVKSALHSPVYVIIKSCASQDGDIYIHVHFGVVENLTVALLLGTPLFTGSSKEYFRSNDASSQSGLPRRSSFRINATIGNTVRSSELLGRWDK